MGTVIRKQEVFNLISTNDEFWIVSVSTVLQTKPKKKKPTQQKNHRALAPAEFLSLLCLLKMSVGSKLFGLYLTYL